MKWLQALVVIMGLMIIIGLIVIGVTIAHRMELHQPLEHRLEIRPTDDAVLKVPKASHLEGVSDVGGNMVLRIVTPDGQQWIYIVDPANGRPISRIMLDSH